MTVKADASINAKNVDELRLQIRNAFEDSIERIIVDLAATESIDSIGLGLLAAVHNSLHQKGSKLELINAKDAICKVLNLMRLDRHFSISCAVE